MSKLELFSTEDLLIELKGRFTAFVALGVHYENPELVTEVMEGPAYMCLGLMHNAYCEASSKIIKGEERT